MEIQKYSLGVIKKIGQLSHDGILVFSTTNDKVEYCNNALTKILGISKESILGSSYEKLRRCLKDDDQFLETQFNRFQTKSKIIDLELRVRSEKDKYISCDAYFLKKASIIICLVKDITNAKQHVNYIVEFGARKDTILDMLAHNLSAPLNMTYSLMDLIDQQNKVKNYKAIDNHSRLIRENTQQCIEIINSFLREEHLASKDIFVESHRFDILTKIKIEVSRLKQFNEQKQIKLISEKKELFVNGDDVKFFQVVHNVLSNAVKFTDTKGKITIEVSDKKDFFTISIKDDGIGIPDFLQPHIFKKNTPAARPGLRGEKSIGMGLYIVKKLVDLMKGEIAFESTENKGTTFILTFPKI